MKMKSVKMFGKKIPILAILMIAILSTGVVSAAIVNYLSNTVTKPTTVSSPIEISGEITCLRGEQTYQLRGSEGGTAEWTKPGYESEYSVKLFTPYVADGVTPFAEVRIDVEDFELDSLKSTGNSFWCYLEEGDLIPYLFFVIPGNYADGGKLLIISQDVYLVDFNDYTKGFAKYETTEDLWNWEIYTANWKWVSGEYEFATLSGMLLSLSGYLGPEIFDDLTVTEVLVEQCHGLGAGPFTAYVDDITVNGVTYNLEPVIGTSTFSDVPLTSFPFYAGDRLHVTVDAVNHANQPIPCDIVVVLEGPILKGPPYAWTYIDIPNNETDVITLGHGCFASGIYEASINPLRIFGRGVGVYVTNAGNYMLAVPHEGEIGPGDSNRIGFEISVSPVLLTEDETGAKIAYTFHILAVTPYSEVNDWYKQVYGNAAAALQQYMDDIIARLPAPPE